MSVSEILAQAPLLLSTILSKQKNMGQPPLVPFLTTFRPLETGDIVIEVTGDVEDIVIALPCYALLCPALLSKHYTISTLLHPTLYISAHSTLHHTSLVPSPGEAQQRRIITSNTRHPPHTPHPFPHQHPFPQPLI